MSINRRSMLQVMPAAALGALAARPALAAEPEQYAMVVFFKGSEFFNWAYAGFQDAAKTMGATTELQGPADWDASAQARAVDELVAKGVKGIAVTAGDADTLTSSIDKGIDKGLPILCFDSDSPKSNRLLYVGTNNFNAGYQAGLVMGKLLGDKGRIGISLLPGLDSIIGRVNGFKAGLAKTAPGAQVVATVNDEGDLQKAETVNTAMLQAHPEINGIFCAAGNSATGAAAATRNVGRDQGSNRVYVMGFAIDVPILQMVENGELVGSVAQNPYLEGVMCFHMLWAAAHKTQFDNMAHPGFGNVPTADLDTGVTILLKGSPTIKALMKPPVI